jgi:hypothetical protein
VTAAREPSLRTRPGPAESELRLAEMLADLGQLGVHGQVVTQRIADEQDVRLRAWRDTGEVTVELLWCCADEPPPRHPAAVRIVDEERTVWCGMHDRCAPAELVRLLCDLLLLDEDGLARHYRRLG